MSNNILYERVDMLDLMESIEDDSKDFILLFMPTGEGSIQGYFDENNLYANTTIVTDDFIAYEGSRKKFIRYNYKEKMSSFENSVFVDEGKYNKHMSLISKVVQNAKRVLNKNGTFCFGVPDEMQLVFEGKGVAMPDIGVLLSSLFSDIRILEVPNFDPYSSKFKGMGTSYRLFLCGPKVRSWSKNSNETIYNIKRNDLPHTREFFEKNADILPQIAFRLPYKGTVSLDPIIDDSLAVLNEVLIHELYNKAAEDILFEDNGMCMRDDIYMPLSDEAEHFKEEFKQLVGEDAGLSITRLSTCLINTFCKAGDKALFPYDRNGQNAYFANAYDLEWVSNIDDSSHIPLTKYSRPGRRVGNTVYTKGLPEGCCTRLSKVTRHRVIEYAPMVVSQNNSWDIKRHNILYLNKDLLQVMESCESNSKDIIILYMPCGDGAVPGYFIEAGFVKDKDILFRSKNEAYISQDYGDFNIDFGNAVFNDEEKYKSYLTLISKVIQNARRVLNQDGTFCFAVPRHLLCHTKSGTTVPEIELMIQQEFPDIRYFGEVCYDTSRTSGGAFIEGTEYDMFICGRRVKKWGRDEEDILSEIQRISTTELDKILIKYVDLIGSNEIRRNKLQNLLKLLFIKEFAFYNEKINLQNEGYLESYLNTLEEPYEKHLYKESRTWDEDIDIIEEAISKKEKRYAEFQNALLSYCYKYDDKEENLAECFMRTFCKENDNALFPYDRNAELAYFAYKFGIQWESAYKYSITKAEASHKNGGELCIYSNEGRGLTGYENEAGDVSNRYSHEDFIMAIPDKNYTIEKSLREHKKMEYDTNFLFSTGDANAMKAQFAKYSNLIGQVVECASTGGEETYGDVEQAVHAIISLAVRAREGTGIINGDEAEKWFGEGWELLSEQCRNYLQTAAAYEKLSQQNGNADCAPIAIEFCRALELETNSVVMKPYIDYYYAHGFQDKTYKGNFKTIQKFQGAVEKQRNNSKEGMMLGQIGTCMRNAPDSVDDKNIFYSFKKYCEENDKEQLLDVDVVGEFQLVGKIRNQSAHPSLLDKGCVSQAKQLVRAALKTQLAVEAKFAHSTVLTCAVVCSPKGNKIDPHSEKMRKAVANQIEMMAQSGVKIFVLTGKFGFNQIVSDELQKYIKANANKDWGKIMVNNASDKGEASKRQKDALSKAQFCIAYYADDVSTQENDQAVSISATKAMVDDAIKEHGLIIWNAYGIE